MPVLQAPSRERLAVVTPVITSVVRKLGLVWEISDSYKMLDLYTNKEVFREESVLPNRESTPRKFPEDATLGAEWGKIKCGLAHKLGLGARDSPPSGRQVPCGAREGGCEGEGFCKGSKGTDTGHPPQRGRGLFLRLAWPPQVPSGRAARGWARPGGAEGAAAARPAREEGGGGAEGCRARGGLRPGGVKGGREEAVAPRSARPSVPLGGKGRALAGFWLGGEAAGGRGTAGQLGSCSTSRPAGSRPGRLSPVMPAEGELSSAATAGPEPGEAQYLRQVRHILQHGHRKEDRTGTGTISVFGMQARYSVRGRHRRDPRPPPQPPTPARRGSSGRRPAPRGAGTPSSSPALSRSRLLRARPPPLQGRGSDPLQGPVEAFRSLPSAPSPSPCPPACGSSDPSSPQTWPGPIAVIWWKNG